MSLLRCSERWQAGIICNQSRTPEFLHPCHSTAPRQSTAAVSNLTILNISLPWPHAQFSPQFLETCHRRVVRKVPEVIESFIDRAAGLLNDRHHGVLLAGVTLMLEICTVEPTVIPVYRQHVPTLARVVKTLLMSPYSPEHDVGGITDPFLQVKVTALLDAASFRARLGVNGGSW